MYITEHTQFEEEEEEERGRKKRVFPVMVSKVTHTRLCLHCLVSEVTRITKDFFLSLSKRREEDKELFKFSHKKKRHNLCHINNQRHL